MRLIVCGGRDVADRDWVWRVLDAIHRKHGIEYLIEGGARGADTLAYEWRESRSVIGKRYPADWDTYGKGAGFRRNEIMAGIGMSHCLGFAGGNGTAHMLRTATERGLIVSRIFPKNIC